MDERTAPAKDLAPPILDDTESDLTPTPDFMGLPNDEWVDAMAEALAADPVYRISNRETAMPYFRGRALAMLDATPDPYARGLMLGWERHRHQRRVPALSANGARCGLTVA